MTDVNAQYDITRLCNGDNYDFLFFNAHTPAVKAEFSSKLCKIKKTLYSLGIVLISEAFV